MSIRSFFARLATKVVAVAVVSAGAASAPAADVTAPPPAAAAAPVTVGMPGCETCQHGAPKASCSTCGKFTLLPRNKEPFQVNLCPGACFGYFQTQWRKWEDACPYPYLGQGANDAPRPVAPAVNVPRTGSELNPPRPFDPKMADPKGPGGVLPPIPGGKFGP